VSHAGGLEGVGRRSIVGKQEESSGAIEFVVDRIPTVRVIFGDWENAVIQIEAGGEPLNIRGTEDRLWIASRVINEETNGAFADQAMDRSRTQSSRLAAIESKHIDLTEVHERVTRQLMLAQALRDKFQKEIESRDGFNRTRATTERFLQEIRRMNPTLLEVDQL